MYLTYMTHVWIYSQFKKFSQKNQNRFQTFEPPYSSFNIRLYKISIIKLIQGISKNNQ